MSDYPYFEEIPHGFQWGPVKVERYAMFPRPGGKSCHVVHVNGLDIYVSPTGRSVRVYRDGKELK